MASSESGALAKYLDRNGAPHVGVSLHMLCDWHCIETIALWPGLGCQFNRILVVIGAQHAPRVGIRCPTDT